MADYTVYPEQEPSKAARALADQVVRDGGHVLAVYQEPVGEHWQLFCLLPRARVVASPYQRDVSPTHVKRLTDLNRYRTTAAPAWVETMRSSRRKTLIVCAHCHGTIHQRSATQ